MPTGKSARHHGRDGTLPTPQRPRSGDRGDAEFPLEETAPTAPDPDVDELRDLYDNAPCGYVLLSMDGTILRTNTAFLALSGYSSETEDKKRFQQFLSSAGSIFWETQILPTLLLQGFRKEIAFDIVRGPGNRVPVLANMALKYDAGGTPVYIRVILLEAKERRLYEKDLLRSRRVAEQMAEVVMHSSDAIISLSPDGRIESWNNGAELMFGYSPEDVTGQMLSQFLFSEENQQKFAKSIPALHKGKVVAMEMTARQRDQRQIDISITLTPHMEAPGTLIAFSAIVRDDSLRRLAERALLQSEKLAAVGRLASSIAHEINNPLESVTNLIYLARQQAIDSDVQVYLDSADAELRRVSIMASQTLRFHKQLSSPSLVTSESLFAEALNVYEGRLKNAGIVLDRKNSVDLPIECFEGDIRQVISHLVTNAIDAMPRGGRLFLRSRNATDWKTNRKGVMLTVADTGMGMPINIRPRIFEAFFTTKGIGGTGLGLWISAEIIERHRGIIKVRSSQRDNSHGTTASVFLPFKSGHAEQEEKSSAECGNSNCNAISEQ